MSARVLLAIDTSMSTSVSLSLTGGARPDSGATAANGDPRGHAEHIGPLLAQVFAMAGVAPSEVTGVVAGIGPGPFTGLRIGIAAAEAFAFARGVPLMPLSGHEAVAYELLRDGAERVRVIQDAKRRELFATEYSGLDDAGLPVRAAGPQLIARADYAPREGDVWPEGISAELLPALARLRLAAGRAFEPDRALYLRQPDVFPSAAPKRVMP